MDAPPVSVVPSKRLSPDATRRAITPPVLLKSVNCFPATFQAPIPKSWSVEHLRVEALKPPVHVVRLKLSAHESALVETFQAPKTALRPKSIFGDTVTVWTLLTPDVERESVGIACKSCGWPSAGMPDWAAFRADVPAAGAAPTGESDVEETGAIGAGFNGAGCTSCGETAVV